MKVCVVGGAGYVGLVTALCLAEVGHKVIGVDVDLQRLRLLEATKLPVQEEGAEQILKRGLQTGRLRFSTNLFRSARDSHVVIIAVDTPASEDGSPEVSRVMQVAEALANCLNNYTVIAIKSTVPLSIVEAVCATLKRKHQEGQDFDIVVNPEFLRQGSGLSDFLSPTRIVLGSHSERALHVMRSLYEPILKQRKPWHHVESSHFVPVPLVETTWASAVLIKYASNAFLTARISFINEIANLCGLIGADVRHVVEGLGYDPRIGREYLAAGPGFGGPCLEKDLRALIKTAEEQGMETLVLSSVLERNERQVEQTIDRLKRLVAPPLSGRIVAVFGLSYKPGTSDVRNSPALRVVERLEAEGATIHAYDPVLLPTAGAQVPNRRYFGDPYRAVEKAEALAILTEWPQFKTLDYQSIRNLMLQPCILDARNLLDPAVMMALGFQYIGTGTGLPQRYTQGVTTKDAGATGEESWMSARS